MKSRVYVETTVVSYLVARPSRDVIITAHLQITQRWWQERRASFDLFVSELVLSEASGGDAEASRRRIEALAGLPVLSMTDTARKIAHRLMTDRVIPAQAVEDALHIALAAAHGMDYLLTWNCRHIANAQLRARIASACEDMGMIAPTICTPEELFGDAP